jgi:hypothetical protein
MNKHKAEWEQDQKLCDEKMDAMEEEDRKAKLSLM